MHELDAVLVFVALDEVLSLVTEYCDGDYLSEHLSGVLIVF